MLHVLLLWQNPKFGFKPMLEFFRRYQKFFFLLITIVIVISFSFFGTYSVFLRGEKSDSVSFIAVDGSKVYQTEVNDLVAILNGDSRDILFRSAGGSGSAFNDGFIVNDLLSTGVAQVMVAPFLKDFASDLTLRFDREKHFTPYVHPHASFISAEAIWAYFAPDLKQNLAALLKQSNPASKQAFDLRVKLYLDERNFPSVYLKQLIGYQQMQSSYVTQDETLPTKDLSLFGYHSLQDWFGKKFLDISAEYVINTAKIAAKKGVRVTRDATLETLSRNLATSFKENQRNPYFLVTSPDEYFQQELRRLGMDQGRLIRAWHNVELYRAYVGSLSNSCVLSPLPYEDFYRELNQYSDVEMYRLPKQFCLQNLNDLEKLQIYLTATGGKNFSSKKILSPSEVKKVYPQLVEKRYRVKYSHVNKDELGLHIGVKKTWEWQVADPNWKVVVEAFPELGVTQAKTAEARFAILEKMDQKVRSRVDTFSRNKMIDEHPEWLEDALKKEGMKDEEAALRDLGGKTPFTGIKNNGEFMRILDSVPLGSQSPALSQYNQDGVNFYRIIVDARNDAPQLLTFKEASADGTLTALLDKALEATYLRVRGQNPQNFVKDNGEWKDLAEVKDQVGEIHFQDLFRRLDNEKVSAEKEMPRFCNWQDKESSRIALFFLPYMQEVYGLIQKSPEKSAEFVVEKGKVDESSVTDQWKLVRAKERLIRRDVPEFASTLEAFSMKPGQLSHLGFLPKEGPLFFKFIEKGTVTSSDGLRQKVYEAKRELGNELQQTLCSNNVNQMVQKKAFNLGLP